MNKQTLVIIRRIERFIGPLLLTGMLFALLFYVVSETESGVSAASVPFPAEMLESSFITETSEVDIDMEPSWLSSARDLTTSVAWADMDGDGDLDLAVGNGIIYDEECFCEIGGQNKIYLNDGNELEEEASWIATERDDTTSVAWADVDADGDLDLAVGNRQTIMPDNACGLTGSPNKVYLNVDGMLETEPSWQSNESDFTTSVAWGDVDGDGDFDLAVGNGTATDLDNDQEPCDVPRNNKIYLNTGTQLETTASWISDEDDETASLAWGDIDDDDDLDLVVGNAGPNRLYQNDAGNLSLVWTSQESENTSSVAWVDVDLDDELDLSVSNIESVGQLYRNEEGSLMPPQPLPPESQDSLTLAWGDTDSDGDLDLVTAGKQHITVYHNMNGALLPIWNSVAEPDRNTSVAWADVDGDGDLDLAVAGGRRSNGELNRIYLNRTLLLGDPWTSQREDNTASLAWGDVDGDGDLDLAVANRSISDSLESSNQLYLNSSEGFSITNSWQPNDNEESYSLAWGDVDGDGDLDLAVGNAPLLDEGGQNKLYLNEGGMLHNTPSWLSDDADFTTSIAWGDYDLDGDLDLVVGNQSTYDAECDCLVDGENKIYENNGEMLDSEAVWLSEEADETNSVVWGDVDGDGDLDLTVGNDGYNRLYLNEEQELSLSWSSSTDDNTASLAWGDYDSDGDLDLMAGNYLSPNRLYQNEEGELTAVWSDGESFGTLAVAWADVEGDGDLDLALGNAIEGTKIYLNQDGSLASEFDNSLSLAGTADSRAVAWGDYDFDGDIDLSIGREGQNQVYVNRRTTQQRHGGQPPAVAIKPILAPADFYATSQIHDDVIRIPFTLFDEEEIEAVDAFYSLDGGGLWLPAVGSITPATGGPAPNNYFYDWDVSASDFFGQSDNVVFRLEAIVEEGTITNSVPGPFEISNISTQSYPFRVRGNQVRVMSGTLPVDNAFVYQLGAGQSNNAEFIGATEPFVTNFDGYLQGRGQLSAGDQLVALLPIKTSETGALPEGGTLYYTSAAPTETGLDFYTIQEGGVHTLTVSAANPLLLFDLDISLEWDARNDEGFIEDIADAIKEASAVLYDVSNGQIGLGDVNVYQAKENWSDAHIVVYASNHIRPSANLGGIVLTSTDDIGLTGVITDAYLPGQIRMGPNWDPFGENTSDLSQEWWRALAHELAHYLLFMPDNYIGISDEGHLTALDCQGSFMTNTHDDDYSEFLTESEWTGDCLQTIAARTTARADWQTISTFYPDLNDTGGNLGPTVLPLNVTFVDLLEPTSVITESIETQNYDLRDAESGTLLPLPRAEGYLFKTQATTDLTDDIIVPLGSTGANGDRIKVRGAQEGDDVCVFGSSGVWVGCTEMTEFNTSLFMAETTNWPPTIEVTPITSRTLIISATLPLGDDSVDALNLQLFPTYADAPTSTVTTAPWDVMLPVDATNQITFTQVITMDYGTFSGFVRLWVPDSSPEKESISQFVLNASVWGGNTRGWGGNTRGWGGNTRGWGAPLTSAEGQLTIFNVEDPFAETGISTLQTLNTLSNLPSWLTLVGNAYRVSLEEDVTQNITRTISFDYLQRDVPDGLEYTLAIYYMADSGQSWQRLATDLDLDENRATTLMPDDTAGIYALISTIEMPPLQAGWNQFGYPIAGTRSVETALASISGDYTSLYFYQPTTDQWLLYDETVAGEHPTYTSLVNDLTHLEFGQSYWIYATEPITLYLGVPESSLTLREGYGTMGRGGEGVPLATFYGPLLSTNTFTPAVGMTINATVNGYLCGQSTVQDIAGQLAYKIQVLADTGNDCATSGQSVHFTIGEQLLGSDSWDNSQARYYPLGEGVPTAVTLHSLTSPNPSLPWAFITLILFGLWMIYVSAHPNKHPSD